MNEEVWKLISGYNGQFLVSSFGRVLNVNTKKLVRPFIHKSRANSYLRVNLNDRKVMVHVLVAEAFLPKHDLDRRQVDHIDRNTLNCNLSNLRWVTASENISLLWESTRINYEGQSMRISR
jgi:hypothetical protein